MKKFEANTENRIKHTSTFAEAFEQLLRVYELEDGYLKVKVVAAWHELFGPVVSKRTKEVFYKDRKLFVRIQSAALKKELSMSKSNIIGLINAKVEKVAITEVVFL